MYHFRNCVLFVNRRKILCLQNCDFYLYSFQACFYEISPKKPKRLYFDAGNRWDFALQDYADSTFIVVDPESGGFLTAEGIEPIAGDYTSGYGVEAEFGNFLEDDDALEMGIRMDLSKFSDDPVLELGFSAQNPGPFIFSGTSIDSGIQYLEAPPTSAVAFVQDEIVYSTLTFSLLDTPLHGCNNGDDDDADGYIDADDPDCDRNGTEEVGYGDTQCNDGIDNNNDGSMDAEDSNCDDAFDDTERLVVKMVRTTMLTDGLILTTPIVNPV